MTYDDIVAAAAKLGYRDKLKLAQSLIQQARREEENSSPIEGNVLFEEAGAIAARLKKLQPKSVAAVKNSIAAMYQFRGGVSEADVVAVLPALACHGVRIDSESRVSYR